MPQRTSLSSRADKMRNGYEMDASTYNKLLTKNVTKIYKHALDSAVKDINEELKTISDKLGISDCIDPINATPTFISLKDHKPDFGNHPKCPTKSELGKVSKAILDNINNQIRGQTQSNRWRNTTEAISSFQSINNKQRKSLISFDIVEFYPSISESLLDRSITWAQDFTEITPKDITIIKHARKSLFFHNNHTWSKRNPESTFDVSMGSFGLFIPGVSKKSIGV